MCLHADSEILTAKKDMKVFKVLIIRDNISPYQYMKYVQGKTVRLRRQLYTGPVVYRGFHSYIQETRAQLCKGYSIRHRKVVEMVIPRGAKYILGINGDVVSTSLRWP